ncbi:MAG TPA: CoA pyrophosphatase [Lacipirellulaceae bacterium]|jgi:8-oxo-dGTP pyrophosphatase MutT (NUDIX family)|nr:CoA pyrophosphatase [Lacipirellulaceae bacterium]
MLFTESKIEALVTSDDLPNWLDVGMREHYRRALRSSAMSPEMSYGRHAGPAPHTARCAAVAILLFRREGRWHLPLTERPATLARHGGQISLPGGVVDAGESSFVAVQRELREELGFCEPHLEIGRLSDVYVFASDFLVTPWILATYEPNVHWRPHDREVQSVVELPLEVLVDERAMGRTTIERGPLVLNAPCFEFGTSCIWGATSVILSELADVIRNLPDDFNRHDFS